MPLKSWPELYFTLKCDKENLMKSLFLICLGRILYLHTNINTSLTKTGLTGKQNSEKWIFEKIKAECPIRRSDVICY